MKSLLEQATQQTANDTDQPSFLEHVKQRLGMTKPEQDPEQHPTVLARKQREAEDATLLSGFMPYQTPKLVEAAKLALEQWLATLPPHRLLQPFYMAELQAIVAHWLAVQGRKKTKLSGHTIALALWALGFAKRRDSGTTRPQTRYWIHPAAAGKRPAK